MADYCLDLLEFAKAVASKWPDLAIGGAIGFVWIAFEKLSDRPISLKIFFLILGISLFFAFFGAWRDQYFENRVGRESGSLAFIGLGGELNRHGDLADPQLEITFKNLKDRLLQYHVDSLSLEIQSKRQAPVFINRGGYVYAGQEGHYRLHPIKDVPLTGSFMSGILEYDISYNLAGSKSSHHSKKKISFDLYFSEPLGGKFSTLEEEEN